MPRAYGAVKEGKHGGWEKSEIVGERPRVPHHPSCRIGEGSESDHGNTLSCPTKAWKLATFGPRTADFPDSETKHFAGLKSELTSCKRKPQHSSIGRRSGEQSELNRYRLGGRQRVGSDLSSL